MNTTNQPLSAREKRIFDEVASTNAKSSTSITRHAKFRKVYRAPGYPVDPRNQRARAKNLYLNAFAPQAPGVIDRRALDTWLVESIN